MHAKWVRGKKRNAALFPLTAILALTFALPRGHSFELNEIVGNWAWKAFLIRISECQDRMCATVVEGPKNVGMELFASDLKKKGEAWVGEVVDPETDEIYFTRLRMHTKDRLKLDGCTKSKVCLSGEFVRRAY